MGSQVFPDLKELVANPSARQQFYAKFQSSLVAFYEDNSMEKSLDYLGQSANLLARVAPYSEEEQFSNFPTELAKLIEWCISRYFDFPSIPAPVYWLCKSFIILNDKGVKKFDKFSLELFMSFQTTMDANLKKLGESHIIHSIRSQNNREEVQNHDELQSWLFEILQDDGGLGEGSLNIICSLYKDNIWVNNNTANAICDASLHESVKVKSAASSFLLCSEMKDTVDGMSTSDQIQLQSSSPIDLVDKKDFGNKIRDYLLRCQDTEILILCKLYLRTMGPDSIFELFTTYLQELIEDEFEEVIGLLLTSFKSGLDKVIDQKRLESLMEIHSLGNRDLSDLVRVHLIDCISNLKDKSCLEEIKSMLLRMVKMVDAKAEGSLVVLCDLYRTKLLSDKNVAHAICHACLRDSSKFTKLASSFILSLGKEDSSTILQEMPRDKLLTRLNGGNLPKGEIIFWRLYALTSETPVISEVVVRDAYVKLQSNQKDVAELLAGELKDYHVKDRRQAQDLLKRVVLGFFDVATTRRSKAAGLLFIREVCISEPQLIDEDMKNAILGVKQTFEAYTSPPKDVVQIIKSARELLDFIQQLDGKMTQGSKRKRVPTMQRVECEDT